MKNLFLALGFATILASCSNSTEEATPTTAADSTATCSDTCKKACDSANAEPAVIVVTTTAVEAK